MTEAETADKLDIVNSESKKPTAYDHDKVGIAYGESRPARHQEGARARRRRDVRPRQR
jgi:hypothetical protein